MHYGGDHASAYLPHRQIVQKLLTLLALAFLQPIAPGQHHIVAGSVDLQDFGFKGLPQIRLKISHPAQIHERGRQKAAQTHIHDETPLDSFYDGAFDDAVRLFDSQDVVPSAFVLGTLLGKDETPFAVFTVKHGGFYDISDFHDLVRFHISAD